MPLPLALTPVVLPRQQTTCPEGGLPPLGFFVDFLQNWGGSALTAYLAAAKLIDVRKFSPRVTF